MAQVKTLSVILILIAGILESAASVWAEESPPLVLTAEKNSQGNTEQYALIFRKDSVDILLNSNFNC